MHTSSRAPALYFQLRGEESPDTRRSTANSFSDDYADYDDEDEAYVPFDAGR